MHYERFFYPDAAITREKQLKGWLRRRKIELIESTNPHWYDLAERWYDMYKPLRPTASPRQILRSACAQDDAGFKGTGCQYPIMHLTTDD